MQRWSIFDDDGILFKIIINLNMDSKGNYQNIANITPKSLEKYVIANLLPDLPDSFNYNGFNFKRIKHKEKNRVSIRRINAEYERQ